MSAILRLPTLERLLVVGDSGLELWQVLQDYNFPAHLGNYEDWKCNMGESAITSINLDDHLYGEGMLKKLFESCKALKHLALVFEPRYWHPDTMYEVHRYVADFDWSAYHRAMASQRPHLENLSLYVTFPFGLVHHNDDDSNLHNWTPFGTTELRHFVSLQTLRIQQVALLGFKKHQSSAQSSDNLSDILPSSLQTLEIEDCNMEIFPQLEELFAVIQTQFTNLRTVEFGPFDFLKPDLTSRAGWLIWRFSVFFSAHLLQGLDAGMGG